LSLVLDTNVYCDFAAGLPEIVDIIASWKGDFFVPSVVLGELHYGFLKGSRRDYNERKLAEIIEVLGIRIIPIDENVARKYGGIYLSLVRKGRKIPINDVWIAASCMAMGGTILTRDRHFEAIDLLDSIIL
jgi:predicted nucleic acid-binding protein